MDNRQQLKELLPYGGIAEVAKLAGVTPGLVTNYFKFRTNSKTVENAVLKYLDEQVEKKKQAEKRHQMLIKALS